MRASRLASSLALAGLSSSAAAQCLFEKTYVDLSYGGNGKPGWVRAADMDGDGDLDLVAGGGLALYVYENQAGGAAWVRHGSLDATGLMGANGAALLDVEGDGDLDVVCAKKEGPLGWWKNPGGPPSSTPWVFHALHPGFAGWYLHDILLADLDGDGQSREVVCALNLGYWGAPVRISWFTPGATPTSAWAAHVVDEPRAGLNHCHAGLSAGDVDGDGDVDLGFSDGWYEASETPDGPWTWHRVVTDVYGISNNLLEDLDADGDLDLVVSAGHHGQGVFWFEAPANPLAGGWTKRSVDPGVIHPEGLQAGDLDGDGDVDLVASELHFGEAPGEPGWDEEAHQVYAYRNVGPAAEPRWSRQNLEPDSYPSHLLQLVDVDQDGRLDLIAEGAGFSSVTYLESRIGECPDVLLSQPAGAGGPVFVHVSGLAGGLHTFNLFGLPAASIALGTGPYLGLAASNLPLLAAQLVQPLGALPVHFLAPGGGDATFGPYAVPPVVLDVVTFQVVTGVGLGAVSAATRFEVE